MRQASSRVVWIVVGVVAGVGAATFFKAPAATAQIQEPRSPIARWCTGVTVDPSGSQPLFRSWSDGTVEFTQFSHDDADNLPVWAPWRNVVR